MTWFNKEAFESALFYGKLFFVLEADSAYTRPCADRIARIAEVTEAMKKAEIDSGYRLDNFIQLLSGDEAPQASAPQVSQLKKPTSKKETPAVKTTVVKKPAPAAKTTAAEKTVPAKKTTAAKKPQVSQPKKPTAAKKTTAAKKPATAVKKPAQTAAPKKPTAAKKPAPPKNGKGKKRNET